MKITGIVNTVFRPKKSIKKAIINQNKILPTLLYGSENWTIKAIDARRTAAAADMKNMRRTAGYTLTDHKTNTEIATELNITPVLDKLQDYKRKWIQHVNRMPVTDYPD
jgi:hypothetical protein